MFSISLKNIFLLLLIGTFLFAGYSATALQCYNSHTTPPDLVECKPDEDACVVLQKDTESKTITKECRQQDPSLPDCNVVELPSEDGDHMKIRWHYCYCKSDGCNNATACYCGGMPPGAYRTGTANSTAAELIHSTSKSTVGIITGLVFIIKIYNLFQDLSQHTQKNTALKQFMQN